MVQKDILDTQIAAFEASIGLRPGFIDELTAADDWSFVIKAHALLEAGVSHLLAHHFGHEQLIDVFSYLDMGAETFGKIAFLSALDLLDSADRGFIRGLGAVRNHFVHRIANVDLTLTAYLDGLSKERRARAYTQLGRVFHGKAPDDLVDPTKEITELTYSELFRRIPEVIITNGLRLVLFNIHVTTEAAKGDTRARRGWEALLRSEILQKLSRAQLSDPPSTTT